MIAHLERRGIETTFANLDAGNVAEQRDFLAAEFLDRKQLTHLLFVDSDMSFPPDLAQTFVELDQPLIGTIYPKRKINLPAVIQAAREGIEDPAVAGYAFNVSTLDDQLVVTANGLCEVGAFGFGFTLIRRDCLATLLDTGKIISYPARFGTRYVAGFFRPIELPDHSFLGEDYSFCKRWRDAGGKVLAYVPADVKHVGDMPFGAPFLARMQMK